MAVWLWERVVRPAGPGHVIACRCNGSTALGLAVARLGRATLVRRPDGVWIGHGYRYGFPTGGAFTIGAVILTRYDPDYLAADDRVAVLRHELRHVTQWAWWGPAFLPAYVVSLGWSLLATGDLAARNVFERSAHLVDGGYDPDIDLRPAMRTAARLTRGARGALAHGWTRMMVELRGRLGR